MASKNDSELEGSDRHIKEVIRALKRIRQAEVDPSADKAIDEDESNDGPEKTDDGELDDEAANFMLEPYDQVAVRINPDYEEVRTVVITGEVEYPGVYSLKSKDETIVDLILRAGGIKSTGDDNAINMYRMMEIEEKPNDEIDFYNDDEEIVNGFFSDGEFVQIIPFNEEKAAPVNKIEKTFIKKYMPVHLNLDKALKYRKSRYNIVLHDLDSINIPQTQDLVAITGALSNFEETSISVPFMERRANYYINNFAGGFSKHNVKSNTLVISPSGSLSKAKDFGLFILYPRVEKGSTIKVTEDVKIKRQKPEPVDWTRILEGTITKISAITSLYILYLSRQQ